MPTVVVPLLDASGTYSSPSSGVPTVASGSEAAPVYDVRIVNRAGTLRVDLPLAEPDVHVETLNAPDEFEFHFPKNAYTDTNIDVLAVNSGADACEVQVYRNGDLLGWGPLIGMSGGGADGVVKCKCAGVDWYLNRLFLDGQITNLLDDPDFESSGVWASTSVSFSTDTTTFVTGTRAALLTQGTAGADAYISQSCVVAGRNLGRLLTVSAWLYIDSFVDSALLTRGLYIEGFRSGVSQGNNYYPIDNATPRGKWQKLTTTLWIPPNQTWTIVTRLYCPKGTVRWDDCKLVAMDSVSAAGNVGITLVSEDIAHIVSVLVTAVQDTVRGKRDLNIGYHVETTGTKLIKVYQYVDHIQFDQALHELLDRNDGADYHISLTPTTRVFFSHAYKRGADRSGAVTLRFDVTDTAGSNCTDYRFTKDGGACITWQTILGEDNGPAREQGEAIDATNTAGVYLQNVTQAPHDSETSSLQPLAEERLGRFAIPPITFDMDVMGSSGFVPVIHCGDLVTVVINDGWAQVNAVYRIMRRSLNCITNILTVTVTKDTL